MRALGIVLVFACCLDCRSHSTNVPGKLAVQLSYRNPGHYASSGWCDIFARTCDVYFVICVGSAEQNFSRGCDVARKKTHVIGPFSDIQLTGHDMIELPLTNSIPKSVQVGIEVWDSDLSSSDDIIAKFVSTETSLSSRSDFRVLELSKTETTIYNENVRVDALIKLTCALHYYGDQCETYCRPDHLTFYCGESGERKCLPGWYGEFCHKADMCFMKPCAPYARCLNTDSEEGRICYCNNGSGPECYQEQRVCDTSPCQNGGVCQTTGPHLDQFVCECKEPWYGPTCSQRYSACAWLMRATATATANTTDPGAEVCLNGGVCQDDATNFSYTCLCPLGWKGEYCQHRDYTAAIVAPVVILVALIVVATLLSLVWKTRWHFKGTYPFVSVKAKRESTKRVQRTPTVEGVEAISNEIYGDAHPHSDRVEFLSAEDEYAMLNEASQHQTVRQSYEGAVRYASLLWDNPTRPKWRKNEEEEEEEATTPTAPFAPSEMATPLIG